ncbi:MAG: L,D-transpeptidase [Verrucomicrobiales bacterium]|nr:L,D-transpeptidase [Verrucomicrobiales bacterium]
MKPRFISQPTRTAAFRGLLALPLLLASCASLPEVEEAEQESAPIAFWHGDDVPGSRKIVIDLTRQEARYYKGESQIGLTPIASGTPSHPTPTGSYRVTEKDVDHRSSCYGAYIDIATGRVVQGDVDSREDPRPPGTRYEGADMRWFMRFNGGIGMHEGFLPGYPASHGCVRMPTDMARTYFYATPVGTSVIVTGSASQAGPGPRLRVGAPALSAHLPEDPEPEPEPAPQPKKKSGKKKKKKKDEAPVLRGQTIYL